MSGQSLVALAGHASTYAFSWIWGNDGKVPRAQHSFGPGLMRDLCKMRPRPYPARLPPAIAQIQHGCILATQIRTTTDRFDYVGHSVRNASRS